MLGWKPSNGQASRDFIERYCNKCIYLLAHYVQDEGMELIYFCPILDNTTDEHVDDYPNQWRVNADGEPFCTAFVALK